MVRILGISGSPERDGITERMLDSALDGVRSDGVVVEKVILNEIDFRPCQECGGCAETGACVLNDDMQAIYKAFDEADGFVVASPIFFGSISAQLKMMIDRFQARWVRKYVLKERPYKKTRKGIFLCASGLDRVEYFENAKQIIKIFFLVLDIDYSGDLYFGGCNKKFKDENQIVAVRNKAFNLGAKLVKELR